MKPQHFAALVSLLVAVALILLLAGRPAPEKEQAADTLPRTVTVMGEGETRARPDQVTLTFGVSTWTQGASAAEAEASNLASRERLTDTLIRMGVVSHEIDAGHPTVAPLTRQDYAGKTYLTGYEASSHVVVTLTALHKAEAVIAAGLANGATGLESVVYGLQSPDGMRQRAVQAALENAVEHASAIVGAQDRTLGELVAVELIQEESPTARTAASPGDLLFRVRVKATYRF